MRSTELQKSFLKEESSADKRLPALCMRTSLLQLQGRDGQQDPVATIDAIEAGGQLQGLAFQCVTQTGQVVDTGKPGKIQVSWHRGAKRVHLRTEPIALPDIQVSTLPTQIRVQAARRSCKKPWRPCSSLQSKQ